MEEQIISLETAKLAKEKGFNQNPYWALKQFNGKAYIPQYANGTGKILLENCLFAPSYNIAIAPPQSIMQKWLRDEFNLHISIWFNKLTNKWRIDYITDFCSGKDIESSDMEYEIFEEALEEGLYQALEVVNLK